jgi:hypothetical protein
MSRERMVTRGHAFAAEFDGELAGDANYLPENKRNKTGCRACGLYRHELSCCFTSSLSSVTRISNHKKNRVKKVSQALKDFELSEEVEAIRRNDRMARNDNYRR